MLPGTLAILLLAAGQLPAADTRRAASPTTALDRYVAAPDPNFSWKRASGL